MPYTIFGQLKCSTQFTRRLERTAEDEEERERLWYRLRDQEIYEAVK